MKGVFRARTRIERGGGLQEEAEGRRGGKRKERDVRDEAGENTAGVLEETVGEGWCRDGVGVVGQDGDDACSVLTRNFSH